MKGIGAQQSGKRHQPSKGRTMKSFTLPVIAAGAIATAALGLAGAAGGPPRGPRRVPGGRPAAGPRIRCDRQQGRHGTTGPMCRQRGAAGSDVLPDGFRCARRDGRHRHHRHGDDRVRRRGVLTEPTSITGREAAGTARGRFRPSLKCSPDRTVSRSNSGTTTLLRAFRPAGRAVEMARIYSLQTPPASSSGLPTW